MRWRNAHLNWKVNSLAWCGVSCTIKEEDAEAIHYHYDVSNDFYRLWLDPDMVYSCAYFENGNETLAEAQMKKIDHILAKVRLRPGDTLLDIGCGWGALVMRVPRASSVPNAWASPCRKIRLNWPGRR